MRRLERLEQLVTGVLGRIEPGSIRTKIDYFERKLNEFQTQMRQLEKINQDSQEEHQALQAWAMGLKPYRRYEPPREFRVGPDPDGESDP
jgi:acyl-homoserine lactone acylase PvdQ